MSAYPIPPSIPIITVLTMIICLPILAISIVNFILLRSLWYTAMVACLILLHHIAYLIITFVQSKRLKNRPARLLIDPEESESESASTHGDKHNDASSTFAMPIPYQKLNIAALVFLFIVTTMAFGMMVEITSKAAAKTTTSPFDSDDVVMDLSARDVRIEIVLTGVLGCAVGALGVNLALCALGRRRARKANEERDAREFIIGAVN